MELAIEALEGLIKSRKDMIAVYNEEFKQAPEVLEKITLAFESEIKELELAVEVLKNHG